MQRERQTIFADFLRHLLPRVVLKRNLAISYTFCLGGLAATTFLLLAMTGVLLLFYYQPTPAAAWRSILFIESSVPAGAYLRALHRLSSHMFLVLLVLHMLRVVLTGAFLPPRQMNWLIGCLLLGLSIFTAYTGYLLPLDQLALWATQTGMELLAILPGGETVRQLLVPDRVGGEMTLLRFYALHVVVLPALIAVLSFLHFYRVRKNRGVLPYL
jgi:quinol-cytochrome oxidoreductase complex cytochrome b subunit